MIAKKGKPTNMTFSPHISITKSTACYTHAYPKIEFKKWDGVFAQ